MSWTLWGNDSMRWGFAAAVFVVTALTLRVGIGVARSRLGTLASRTRTRLDDLMGEVLRRTSPPFVLLASLWAAAQTLELPPAMERHVQSLIVVALILQTAFWASGVVGFSIERYRDRQLERDPGGATAIGAMSFIGRVLVWSLAALLVLDNLGVDVTALITGLGIGGVAVALALQSILSDLFASLSIVLDKPFVVGDFLVVGDLMGTVERVGLKTTRIRSLSGEEVVASNSDLLGSRIHNFKRMAERRAVFQIGVTYDTTSAQLAEVPRMIREIVVRQPGVRFERCHFRALGSSAFEFETVYHVLTPDYGSYMDLQQAINLELVRRFAAEQIEFAYPTQTVIARVTRNHGDRIPGAAR